MSRIYEALIDRFHVSHFTINRGAINILPKLGGKNSVDDKIIALLEDARESFDVGFPDLGIPPLDPISLENFHTHIYQKGIINADVNFQKISIAGLKAFAIENFNFKIVGLSVAFEFSIPKLILDSKYNVDGKVASFIPFKPKGDANAQATEVTVKGAATLGTNNGYLFVKAFSTSFDLKKIKVSLSGMLGNGLINSLFNWVLTRISDKVVQKQRDIIAEKASDFILDIANDILKNVKLSDLIG